jgi:type II secretory pathway pseudopilin PulG
VTTTTHPRSGERGFSLAGLMAALAIMLILMTAAVPSWTYVMKDMREEELLFRGMQIADAVGRYQQKNGNAPPPSMEVLIKGKYLRKNYKEPFAKDGRWKFIRPGEPLGVPTIPGAVPGGVPNAPPGANQPFQNQQPFGPNQPGGPSPSPSPSASPSSGFGALGPSGEPLGGFIGVSSKSTDKSLRLFNGRDRYSEWQFLPSPYPRIIGRPPTVRGAAPPPANLQPGGNQFPGNQPPPPGGGNVVPPGGNQPQ